MATLGTNTSADALNSAACALAQARHENAYAVVELAAYVDKIDIAGLELAGFDSGQATSFKTMIDDMKTDALIWLGQAQQVGNFDFSNACAVLIGPNPQG